VVDDMVVISVGAPSGAWEPSSTSAESAAADSESSSTNVTAAATLTSGSGYNSSLVAFDIETGDVRWTSGSRQASYASPVAATLSGERQIVVVEESWVAGYRPSDGTMRWEFPWVEPEDKNASCSQPVPIDDNRLFLSKGYSVGGASLLSIERDAAGKFSVAPLWDPRKKPVMKTKLCNVVIHNGHVYGLHDKLLQCVEVETGKVKWTKRRQPVFGHGQIMLIGETILVLSESGELALVGASPDEYRELASMQALSDANVTWNNPAFSPPYLLVRNAREAACYRLPLK
jgi:outer membrane protein assembly factor BamB